VAAADVQLRHGDPVLLVNAGQECDQLPDFLFVRAETAHLRPDVGVHAGQLQRLLPEHPPDGLGRVAGRQRQAELLVFGAGGQGRMGVRVHTWDDPQQHPLRPIRLGCQPGDLTERVDHDPADTIIARISEVRGGFGVSMENHPLGWESDRASDGHLTGRTHVE
jgi:hypothetical protein